MTKPETILRRQMIGRLVEPPSQGERSKFWPREMKLAKQLLSKFPDEKFWSGATFPVKFKSLAGLFTKFGHEQLERQYQRFHFVLPEATQQVPLSDGKFGESADNAILHKPRCLADFLK